MKESLSSSINHKSNSLRAGVGAAVAAGLAVVALASPAAAVAPERATLITIEQGERTPGAIADKLSREIQQGQPVGVLNGDLVITSTDGKSERQLPHVLVIARDSENFHDFANPGDYWFFVPSYNATTGSPDLTQVQTDGMHARLELASDGHGSGFPQIGPILGVKLEVRQAEPNQMLGHDTEVNGQPAFIDYDGNATVKVAGSEDYIRTLADRVSKVYGFDYSIPNVVDPDADGTYGATVTMGQEFTRPVTQ